MKLLEAIKVLDGECYNLEYHLARMRSSSKAIFGTELDLDLDPVLSKAKSLAEGLYKLRISYDPRSFDSEFIPYVLKPKQSLKLVFHDTVSYNHKLSDRATLHELYEQRGQEDDIIIVKNGRLTDSYYCNLALLKEGEWYTPRLPLLPGTKRAQLLDEGIIQAADILLDELHYYSRVRLFNAIIEFGEVELSLSQIY